jgi:S1-C subfamily serine protease
LPVTLGELLKHSPQEIDPRKIWRVDAHDDVNGSDTPAGSVPNNTVPVKDARKRRVLVIGAYIAAAAAFTAVGFGATSVIRDQSGSASAAWVNPTPPPANQTFVEDDDGTGADSQENILQSTVPGLARITSAHAGQSTGGPVVNLSGQVVGIDLSGSAHGADITSYAVPMNEALRVAQQLRH